MKPGLCCCGGTTAPEQFCGVITSSSAFRQKSFRIVFPEVFPLSKGRVVPPTDDVRDKGKCASTANHVGWSMPTCSYYNELYLYDVLSDQCNNELSDFCWEAYGPSELSNGPNTWNFTGEQLYQVQGTSYTITKSFGDFSTKVLQLSFTRCYSVFGTNSVNRSVLSVDVSFQYQVNRRICVNGAFRQRNANCYYQAFYVGDPYPLDVGISDVLYLKAITVTDPLYCSVTGDPEGWVTYVDGSPSWRGLGSQGSVLQPGSYPGLLPNTLSLITL